MEFDRICGEGARTITPGLSRLIDDAKERNWEVDTSGSDVGSPTPARKRQNLDFMYIDRHIRTSRDYAKNGYFDRIHKVAAEITRKQMLVLEGTGTKSDRIIDLDAMKENPGGFNWTKRPHARWDHSCFSLFVQETDRTTREMKVRLDINTVWDTLGNVETDGVEYWVGFFDFPMIDNTRLGNDQRCAVVLNAFEDGIADVTLAYFPGSYASLKEKPYYQDVVQNLMRSNALLDQQGKKP